MANKKSEILDETEVTNEVDHQVNETAALDTLQPNSMPVGPANKANALGQIMQAFTFMDDETINKLVATLNQVGTEGKAIGDGDAAKNKATIDAKPSHAVGEEVDEVINNIISEDLNAIFEGNELSEEFKTNFSTLFESAVNMKVAKRELELQEEYDSRLTSEIEELTEQLVASLDDYLDDTVNDWLVENEVAIESSLKSDLTEQFLEGLYELFATNYISVPEDKVDIIEEMNARIEELTDLVNDKLHENVELQKEIEKRDNELIKNEVEGILSSNKDDLTESEFEKLSELAESISYDTVDEFKTKLSVLKEQYFNTERKTTTASVLFEETEVIEEEINNDKPLDPVMSRYLSAIKANH